MENPISNESIGKRVAALRKKQHLTQAQLADLVGATAKTYFRDRTWYYRNFYRHAGSSK